MVKMSQLSFHVVRRGLSISGLMHKTKSAKTVMGHDLVQSNLAAISLLSMYTASTVPAYSFDK